jgi:hypothetical protein
MYATARFQWNSKLNLRSTKSLDKEIYSTCYKYFALIRIWHKHCCYVSTFVFTFTFNTL